MTWGSDWVDYTGIAHHIPDWYHVGAPTDTPTWPANVGRARIKRQGLDPNIAPDDWTSVAMQLQGGGDDAIGDLLQGARDDKELESMGYSLLPYFPSGKPNYSPAYPPGFLDWVKSGPYISKNLSTPEGLDSALYAFFESQGMYLYDLDLVQLWLEQKGWSLYSRRIAGQNASMVAYFSRGGSMVSDALLRNFQDTRADFVQMVAMALPAVSGVVSWAGAAAAETTAATGGAVADLFSPTQIFGGMSDVVVTDIASLPTIYDLGLTTTEVFAPVADVLAPSVTEIFAAPDLFSPTQIFGGMPDIPIVDLSLPEVAPVYDVGLPLPETTEIFGNLPDVANVVETAFPQSPVSGSTEIFGNLPEVSGVLDIPPPPLSTAGVMSGSLLPAISTAVKTAATLTSAAAAVVGALQAVQQAGRPAPVNAVTRREGTGGGLPGQPYVLPDGTTVVANGDGTWAAVGADGSAALFGIPKQWLVVGAVVAAALYATRKRSSNEPV